MTLFERKCSYNSSENALGVLFDISSWQFHLPIDYQIKPLHLYQLLIVSGPRHLFVMPIWEFWVYLLSY